MSETDQFATRLRVLKDRAGISFEQLAERSGVSRSSLHRYCSGTKVPANYGAVHALAKACGADGEELREVHRLWALADAERSSSRDGAEEPAEPAEETREPARRGVRLPVIGIALAGSALVVAAVVVGVVMSDHHGGSAATSNRPVTYQTSAPMRVFNIEGDCKTRKDRIPACSMGLARDPRRKYAAGNVVSHRVWHNDVLIADCVLYDGDRVEDETGDGTTRWFRVRLGDVPGGYAWLPAVRSHDNPTLPTCK